MAKPHKYFGEDNIGKTAPEPAAPRHSGELFPSHTSASLLKNADQSASAPVSRISGKAAASRSESSAKRISNVLGKSGQAIKAGWQGKTAWKKYGPMGAILIALIVGAGGLIGGQSMFFQNFTAAITRKFDMSGHFNARRTTEIVKIKTNTKNLVDVSVTGKTRYGRISERYSNKLSQNFDLLDVDGNVITGKVSKGQLVGIREKGAATALSPEDFVDKYLEDAAFRSKVDRAYKGNVATKYDSTSGTIKRNQGIRPENSRGTKLDDGKADLDENGAELTPEEKAKTRMEEQNTIQRQVKDGSNQWEFDGCDGASCYQKAIDSDGNEIRQAVSGLDEATEDSARAAIAATNEASEASAEQAAKLSAALKESAQSGTSSILKNVTLAISGLAIADTVCTMYQFTEGIRKGIKTLQRQDIMNASTQALANMDAIKAGEADPSVTAAMGNAMFAKTSYDILDETDSPDEDYDITATGAIGKSVDGYNSTTHQQSEALSGPETPSYMWLIGQSLNSIDPGLGSFVVGLGGIIAAFVNLIHDLVSGIFLGSTTVADGFCKAATNTFVQIGAAAGAIGIAIFSAGSSAVVQTGAKATATNIIKAGVQRLASSMFKSGLRRTIVNVAKISIGILAPFLMAWGAKKLTSLAAGEVCKNILGQDGTNCIITGAGAKASSEATGGGGLIMTKEASVGMLSEYQDYLARTAEDERYGRSPFDMSSPYTFLGSLSYSTMAYASSLNSVTGVLSSFTGLLSSSIAAILPSAGAISVAELTMSSELCTDKVATSSEFNLATDPFCNPVVGLPAGVINNPIYSPDKVLDHFTGQFTMTDDGNVTIKSGTELSKFRDDCINRTYMDMIDDVNLDLCVYGNGRGCEPEKIWLALFFVDTRIEDNLSGNGLANVSNLALEYAASNNIAYYDISQTDDSTILALMERGSADQTSFLGNLSTNFRFMFNNMALGF
jgi:hypothetical protein